ncbi:MAG: endonuclease III [Dehalococcoidales bacterium]|jgi:endonuclease-3|nr:endonuclease III [Dehalococcoidales bacterium]
MTATIDISELIRRLDVAYPDAKIALHYSNPMELLVATILSAQSTDIMVNRITAMVFRKYRSVKDYADADIRKFEMEIKSAGFYHNKAKHIIEAARLILTDFNGNIPSTMEEMITLPGVARKTANIVLYNAFGVISGIAVDTHVSRLSQRLGLSKNNDPVKIEKDLMQSVPKSRWGSFPYLLIEHGRAICIARKPKCRECMLNDICPSVFII